MNINNSAIFDVNKMSVYLVSGTIEDGMQGMPFILGIFDQMDVALQQTMNFIGDDKCQVSENWCYEVETQHMIYVLQIKEYKLNQVIQPF